MIGQQSSLRNYYSTAVVEDASHIRFNELYLGYDLPVKGGSKFLKSLTVYSQVRNLGLLWKATDTEADPEYRIGTIKPVQTYTFGLRVGF